MDLHVIARVAMPEELLGRFTYFDLEVPNAIRRRAARLAIYICIRHRSGYWHRSLGQRCCERLWIYARIVPAFPI
jgi:hypothetical protein